jgi:hypothetical protein
MKTASEPKQDRSPINGGGACLQTIPLFRRVGSPLAGEVKRSLASALPATLSRHCRSLFAGDLSLRSLASALPTIRMD